MPNGFAVKSRAAVVVLAVLGLIGGAWVVQAADAKRQKLKVTVTPKTIQAGGSVKVKFRGTKRTKCALTVRADRLGSKVAHRRRVKRASTLKFAVTSKPGGRIVSIRCGKARASTGLTVLSVPQAATPTTTLGRLPVDAGVVDGYKVAGNFGGGGFSTLVPLDKGTRVRISQGPGGAVSHFDQFSRNAVDLDAGAGANVRAGFTGVVVGVGKNCDPNGFSDCNNGWGNFVLLKHVEGSCAVHGHMAEVSVAAGDQVERYTKLGTVGASGHTSGPHLHYDRIACGSQLSLPWQFFEAGGFPAAGEFVVSSNDVPPPSGTSTPTPTPTPVKTPTPAPVKTPTPAPTQAPVPQPWVSISKGASAQGKPGCSSSACRWLVVNWGNFGGGGHTVRAYENGAEWYAYGVSGGGGSSTYLYYGWPGKSVRVTVDGVGSNTIVW